MGIGWGRQKVSDSCILVVGLMLLKGGDLQEGRNAGPTDRMKRVPKMDQDARDGWWTRANAG